MAAETIGTPMDERQWFRDYFARYQRALGVEEVRADLLQLRDWIAAAGAAGGKVIVAGNGGSAAIASHCALDFTKQAGVRTVCFSDSSFVTALANDYGYERWVAEALAAHADDGDLVVLISSGGRSPNMLQAAAYARARGLRLVTFSGFDADNPLRTQGDLNFWVDSRAYNVVEMTHHIWLMAVCDLLIGTADYSVDRRRTGERAE